MQRAPIVVALGHVDHGKTTLLDTLKKTRIAAGEVGGITQSIGAYQLTYKGKRLTVIDTPGHAAFHAMRAGGAHVADLALLVIAVNDGIQPQTLEALEIIREAKIPYIVAINKIDLPNADAARVKSQLAEHESAVEGFGGTIPVVEISAKEGIHIPELLDMIFLVYNLSEVSGSPEQPLEAPVIESRRDARAGPLVSVIIRSGKISLGDQVAAGHIPGKVKALFGHLGNRIDKALPGDPVQILGFQDIVPVGDVVRQSAQKEGEKYPIPAQNRSPKTIRVLPEIPRSRYVVKADSVGTLAALLTSLPKEGAVISSSIGNISESDVLLAESTNAVIIGFRVKTPKSVASLAEEHGVSIITDIVIYKLLERLSASEIPEVIYNELGHAKIVKLFDISGQKIIGCTVTSGRLAVGDLASLGEDPPCYMVKQLKKGKADATSVKVGEECGVFLTAPNGQELKCTIGNDIIALEKKKGRISA